MVASLIIVNVFFFLKLHYIVGMTNYVRIGNGRCVLLRVCDGNLG